MGMSKRKAAMLIVLGLILVVAAIVVIAVDIDKETSATAEISTPTHDKGWLAVAPGRVEPRSGLVRIAAPVVGIVAKVLVKPNDTVFVGEPLIQLRDDELQARLTAAEAQVAVRMRGRNERSTAGKAGERRKAEDAVADAEKAVFDARAAIDKAAAKWRASGEPDAALTAARAAFVRAQDDLTKRRDQLREIEPDAPLPTLTEAQLSAARAELSVARAALEKMTIRAPIDGTVLQVNVKAGELAAPSAARPLLLLANLTALRVRAELDERDVTGIRIGQTASVRAAAFPEREFVGKVSSIAPLVEPARLGSRGAANQSDIDAVDVMIDLEKPGPLATGMRVDVYFDREAPVAK